MATPVQTARVIRFGAYEVNLRAAELHKNGSRIKLQDQPFQVLCLLLERPGELVTREELQQKLWPADTFVDFDNGLNTAIKKLRDTLGDSAETPRYVQTVPRRGYRFICPVEQSPEPAAEARATLLRRGPNRRLLVMLGVIVALAALLALPYIRRRLFGPTLPVRSVIVLPFDNLTGDTRHDHRGISVPDLITTDLVKVGKLTVPSVTSARYYKNRKLGLKDITSALEAEAAVEGSISLRGEWLVVNVQLVHGATDKHFWARIYEFREAELQSRIPQISRDLLEAMQVPVTPEELALIRLEKPATAAAFDAFERAVGFLAAGTDADRAQAAPLLEQAIAADPSFAPAYARLAMMHSHGGFYRSPLSNAESSAKALELATKALELDSTEELAHLARASALTHKKDFAAAEQHYRRALELAPSNAIAHDWYGQFLANFRRFDEAIAHADQAHRLAPANVATLAHCAIIYYEAGRIDDAMAVVNSALAIKPDYWAGHSVIARIYIVKGEYRKAIEHFEKSLAGDSMHPGMARVQMAYAYALLRDHEKLKNIIADQKKPRFNPRQGRVVTPQPGEPWFLMQWVHLGLGERDKVMQILEERKPGVGLNSEPLWDPMRTDPRFQELFRRMGVPEANIGKQPMYPGLAARALENKLH